jgi:colicin V production protein
MVIDYLLLLIIAVCAWSLVREGMWGAGLIFFECLFAGLLAMNFYEPLAGVIANVAFLRNAADMIAMCLVFGVVVTVLREIDIRIAPEMVRFPNWLHRAGGLTFGLATGWLMAGFLLCAFQTIPLKPNLGLGYSIEKEKKCLFGSGVDVQWLAFVHRTTDRVFDQSPPRPFDSDASFVDRYYAIRHHNADIAASAPAPEGADADSGATRKQF